ncbi:Mur ligase family protein [Candidatus Odyssella acanthamoebae]|uniref:UDP-N-acetylmuramyl-tripeptide synthetase n=1 Tax=Candidatus Odyssella acanthamoebae TaxID=91604 RepID=A0A077B0Z5_9PROT|nr:UDP-N-acetylmuramoyl-L-alanyl-D-glutamate--2,6-diaminopimelate ligase [Candidatus Paracaedibacter acanthamoebae]AIK96615.1 hypothetical protein ID47_07605 [Candidatus Paracaedibacter acanthamoebae]
MKLKSLIKSIALSTFGELDVVDIKLSANTVNRGDLFVCLEELNIPHIEDEVRTASFRGASCIILAVPLKSLITFNKIPIFKVDNIRKLLSEMASNFYPSSIPNIIGVTGTYGKTSTVSFIRQLLNSLDYNVGSLGTLGLWIKETELGSFPRIMTTPPAIYIHYILHYLSARRVDYFAMEVTSHGLDRHRLDDVLFKVGLFTNFGASHLDYHQSMEHYYASKRKFFSEVLEPSAVGVFNSEQSWSNDILSICRDRRIKSVLIGKDLRVEHSVVNSEGTELTINCFGEKKNIHIPFISTFQTENILFSIGSLIGLNKDIGLVLDSVSKLKSVEGRMELVCSKNGAPIFVDFAHRPETFEKIFQPLKEQGKNIVLVFGCGGGGNKECRTLLGKIAAKYATRVIVTDDNARNEDPRQIRRMILQGCPKAIEIPDRRNAIYTALEGLTENDVCIVAGRGSEEIQVIKGKEIAFNDKAEILKALSTIDFTLTS